MNHAMLGNCLLGAIALMIAKRTWKIRCLWRGRTVPHFYVVARDGTRWHFGLVRDVLPLPVGYAMFWGAFGPMTKLKPKGVDG